MPMDVLASLGCNGCHGTTSSTGSSVSIDNRPLDDSFRNMSTGGFQGHHRTHLPPTATAVTCAKCHIGSENYTSSHRDGYIQLASNINSSPAGAKYNNISATFHNRTTFFRQTAKPRLSTCSDVNCHFERKTPVWGTVPAYTAPNDCNQCHGFPPTSGNHPSVSGIGKKHGDYYGVGATAADACRHCHTTHTTFAHATSAGKRSLIVQFKVFPNVSGAYSGDVSYPTYLPSAAPARNGTCSSLYCHTNGRNGNPLQVPQWGGTLAGCRGCHGSAGDAALSGAHAGHTKGPQPAFACERCHSATANSTGGIKDFTAHLNRQVDIAFSDGQGAFEPTDKSCSATRCHTDGQGREANLPKKWTDSGPARCYWCHRGLTADSRDPAACNEMNGTWNPDTQLCTPYVNMTSNGHARLVGPQWIRQYACTYCHNGTVNSGNDIIDSTKHMNGAKDVQISPEWNIVGRPAASYNPVDKSCDNLYCHSDGTTNPGPVRKLEWKKKKTECNTCHGHEQGSCNTCHDGHVDSTGKVWKNISGNQWAPGQEWKAAIPMFGNQGPGSDRSNSHPRHVQTNFTCDICHAATVVNGACNAVGCHVDARPVGFMGEKAHIDGAYHVNKVKDVVFRNHSGSYSHVTRTCNNTACHLATSPIWGGSVTSSVVCIDCHGSTTGDVDDYVNKSGQRAKIYLTEWYGSGHGRYSTSGRYPSSNNAAANFGINGCWYCHDPNVLHDDTSNPFRVRKHVQFEKRFEKECMYCHMEGLGTECMSCHNSIESLAPQLKDIKPPNFTTDHSALTAGECRTCHAADDQIHKTGGRFWTIDEKRDVRNQYVMMGVCLQCHDDDSNNQCTTCHVSPPENPFKYSIGFNPGLPGTRFIKPKKARASGSHFGFKHFRRYSKQTDKTVWPGGKFCWDCHDPHGDSNIFMIHAEVATSTDGINGKPKSRAPVSFTRKVSGKDYANSDASKPYNGICNVCHSTDSKHYTWEKGDRHNESRICTSCHEHKFADSHASGKLCTTCHANAKPVPKHSAFGLPRDCTKCHAGIIGARTDVMTQFKANSHHIQGTTVTNTHCYACHWEATSAGLIDVAYHEGYNYKLYTTVKNAPVDLVIWGPKVRPSTYKLVTTAVRFSANNVTARSEVSKVTSHCVSCHSDQNNDTQPFDDCRTPRQYAWDFQSIAARYQQTGTTTFGKYVGQARYSGAVKNQTKAYSAHGNAAANAGGGWSSATGVDRVLTNTRAGAVNVECFDCHNSHGSAVVGVTSSYRTWNNSRNGANLKETQAGKGGYAMSYKASGNTTGVNPYGAGAGQCFDCHETAMATMTPWGYSQTFTAAAPIIGYKDTPRFGNGTKASAARFDGFRSTKTVVGGHLKASSSLVKASGTATAGTASSLTAAAAWTAKRWVDYGVKMTSGENQGEIRLIIDNTDTTLTLSEPFARPIQSGDGYQIVPYLEEINGLCSGCHDPHGVSPVLGANKQYGVPLLKGAWLTSPYREDAPPPDPSGTRSQPPNAWGTSGYYDPSMPPKSNHNLDRNTFGPGGKVAESDQQFAGLCVKCHRKGSLTDGTTKNQPFRSVDRIHESVKGWGGTGGNTEHSFTCSKCHQPHNSGLPRLMVTNCLDAKHRGNRVATGTPWRSMLVDYRAQQYGVEYRGFPIANLLGNGVEPLTSCHAGAPLNPGNDPQKTPAQNWPNNNIWNSVTPW
jgi:predicted CxxxxCH...CXXCH cytochrome family protein